MKTYTVLRDFTDDVGGGVYYKGQEYPRPGVAPSQERVRYLGSSENRIGEPVILVEQPFEKMTLPELRAYADKRGIDLQDAKKREEILAAIALAQRAEAE